MSCRGKRFGAFCACMLHRRDRKFAGMHVGFNMFYEHGGFCIPRLRLQMLWRSKLEDKNDDDDVEGGEKHGCS